MLYGFGGGMQKHLSLVMQMIDFMWRNHGQRNFSGLAGHAWSSGRRHYAQ